MTNLYNSRTFATAAASAEEVYKAGQKSINNI